MGEHRPKEVVLLLAKYHSGGDGTTSSNPIIIIYSIIFGDLDMYKAFYFG